MRRRKRFIKSRRTYLDSTAEESLPAGRASGQKAELFDVKEDIPLVPKELHELARHIDCRPIDRYEDFVTFDYHLCRLSHARSLVDLCLGELLRAFKKVHGEIGYSKIDDFADEHLSFSGRLAHEMILNYERLQALPLTCEAYVKGSIVKSALRLLLRIATKENEANLLNEIEGLSVREIEELVRQRLKTIKACGSRTKKSGGNKVEGAPATATTVENAAVDGVNGEFGAEESGEAGVVPPAVYKENTESILTQEEMPSSEIPSEEADRDEGSGVVMKFDVPRTLALTWDFALEHFRENRRTKGPVYAFVEELMAGFMDSTADIVSSRKPESSGANPEHELADLAIARQAVQQATQQAVQQATQQASQQAAHSKARPAAQAMTLFDAKTASEDEPAFSNGR